jgi:nitroimidazol reductase NimA-like FMN-containing flavoprotein (pyridoxamine 5'-phosphate oxidase superfamily)
MVVQQMTEPECRAMLARTQIARLACARNNQPYVVPIHVEIDGAHLYGHSGQGQKIEWMRENPLVCLEVDEFVSQRAWATLVILGRFEELPASPDYADLRRQAEQLFQRHPMWWEPGAVPLEGDDYRARVVFRIQILEMTGRRGSARVVEAPHVFPDSSAPADARWLTRILRRWRGGSPEAPAQE